MLLVGALTVVCFLPVLDNGFVNYDDYTNFVHNTRYRTLNGESLWWMLTLRWGNYTPLAWLVHWQTHAVWGLDPRGWHFTSLAVHTLNAMLAFCVIRKLLEQAGPSAGWGAAVGAAWFALHPLRGESVAWASTQVDLLGTGWGLLCLLLYLRRSPLPLVLLVYAISVYSKPWAMSFPAVLLVIDVLVTRRHLTESWKELLTEKLYFLMVALPALVMAPIAQHWAGAMPGLDRYSIVDRAFIACYALCFYLYKALVPLGFCPVWELEAQVRPLSLPYMGSLIGVVVITGATLALRKRWPGLLAAWLCFVLVLSPVLGFFQSGPSKAADRYTYAPFVALAALLGAAAVRLQIGARGGLIGLALIAGLLGPLSWRQVDTWQDSETLWRHTLTVVPHSYVATHNLGMTFYQAGQPEEAFPWFEKASRLRPDQPHAWLNMGSIHLTRGELDRAIASFERAMTCQPNWDLAKQKAGEAYYQRARRHLRAGQREQALADDSRARLLNPAVPPLRR